MAKLIKASTQSETVTVGELIEKLQSYDSKLPVAFVWENQIKPVILDRFEVMQETDAVYGPVLLMDADD